MRVFGLLALQLVAVDSLACRELQWSTSEWAENPEAVYIGEIKSASKVPVSSKEIVEPDPFMRSIRSAYLDSLADTNLVVHVSETLKGEPVESLNITISWCGGGSWSVSDKAALFQNGGQWHIKNSVEAIFETKAALTKRSI